jgi:hypothetical protein
MIAITREGDFVSRAESEWLIHPREYSHDPRVEYYIFSTTMKRN